MVRLDYPLKFIEIEVMLMICFVYSTAKQFFVKINSVHVNIQFTKELEQHNQLPYLDVLVTKSVDKFKTSVFREKN